VIEHLLRSHEALQIVARSSDRKHLLAHSCSLSPELIVVNTRLTGRRIAETLAEIRRGSPRSKLILVCPAEEYFPAVGPCGADADLNEEALVKRLPALVDRLLRPTGPAVGADRA
jgi:hypothetical protein